MKDNLALGCVFMLGATVLFSVSDAIAKYLVGTLPAVEIAWVRYGVFVLLAGFVARRGRRPTLRSHRPWMQIARGLGILGSAVFFIMSLGALPMAQASALNFVSPLIVTLLAIPFLGEVVRPRGWAALAAGFVGMLIVVRPGVDGLNPAAGLVLLSSLAWCSAIIITRKIAAVERPAVTLFWTAASGWAVLTVILPFFLAPLTWRQFALTIVLGVIASAAQFLTILAYRSARATVLAPLGYAQLIWSASLGFMVFGTAPDRWVLLGAVIIAASGITVVNSARQSTQQSAQQSVAGARPTLELPGKPARE